MAASYLHRKALGAYGERLAVRRLEQCGLRVVDRNWRCGDGEIDVVAVDGRTLVVCEVKTRSSNRFGTPLEAITPTKAARLHRLGWAWADAHAAIGYRLRVDVVCVFVPPRGGVSIDHLVGVM